MIRSNFTAELHCNKGQVGVANKPIGSHPIMSAGEDGWLCVGRPDEAGFDRIRFKFAFIQQDGERTHYNISGAESFAFKGASLCQSSAGWLGLYGTFVVGRLTDLINPKGAGSLYADLWKIETLQAWDGSDEGAEQVEFYLRDSQGHRVANVRSEYSGHYLHAGERSGEVLTFRLKNIEHEWSLLG